MSTTIYMGNMRTARELGEVEQAKAFALTVSEFGTRLKEVVSDAIDGYTFDVKAVVRTLSGEFSFRLVEDAIAHLVRQREHDGRISQSSKKWANSVERPYLLEGLNGDSLHSVYLDAIAGEVMIDHLFGGI